jgi:3D-(3,5/4)-trihydroxycyclohexane-1,2-dione acylhydrolase (decyclizing)
VTVVADAQLALRALAQGLSGWSAPAPWRERALDERRSWTQELHDDLAPRPGERMTQGQVLRKLNELSTRGDRLVVAAGTPHVDVHKLWETSGSAPCLMEVGFSCMGGEIPSALGVRMARGSEGEVYAVIGDGTYLMGNTGELVTARQEGLKITVLVVENDGYQSIHGLQRARTGRSFGLEFGVDVDYAANARSLGCAAFVVSSLNELRDALEEALGETVPTVIVARVEPRRLMLDSGCWWDVGVAQVSERAETRELAAEHARCRSLQRHYG